MCGGVGLSVLTPVLVPIVIVMRHCLAQIDYREHDEDECLNEGYEDGQNEQYARDHPGRKAAECFGYLFVSEDIDKETNTKRRGPHEITYYLNNENYCSDRHEPPAQASGEVLQIAYSLLSKAHAYIV